MTTTLVITDEQPTANGWSFCIRKSADDAGQEQLLILLSWVDYDYWSKGSATPARVVEAVINALIQNNGWDALRSPFDLALSRRLCPGIDAEVRRVL